MKSLEQKLEVMEKRMAEETKKHHEEEEKLEYRALNAEAEVQ